MSTVPRDEGRLLSLLKRHGWNATSFQALEAGLDYWFDGDACVAYFDTGGAWIAAGAPVAEARRVGAVAGRFVEAARRARKRAAFFAVEPRFGRLAPQLRLVHVGEQPVWDPQSWTPNAGLREQMRRARAKGVGVREVNAGEPSLRARVEALIARWRARRPMAPMGFLVELELFDNAAERRWFVAERGEVLLGVLAVVPVFARRGWLLEDLVRDPDAPNGTMELLAAEALRCFGAERCRFATLGMAPLSGSTRGWLRLAARLGEGLFHFRGLHAFKRRLRPTSWTPLYLAIPAAGTELRAVVDVLVAFARGSPARFVLATASRAPAPLLRGLAALLLPWTLLLAVADPRWFPSAAVRWAWVAFDLVVAFGMLRLAGRRRRRCAGALAAAITADAVLTAAQLVSYNLARARGPLDFTVLAVAVAAPAAVAALLGSAWLVNPEAAWAPEPQAARREVSERRRRRGRRAAAAR